jgi:phosphoribosylaminoimidazole-succinocarboxamide synthase
MPRGDYENPSRAVVVDIEGLPFPIFRRGKVRDVFDLGDQLLIVATDRLSAFDVVLPTPIPGKGRILTAISEYWFDQTEGIVPNHRSGATLDSLGLSDEALSILDGRATVVRKADRIDIECVVRGNIAGSGWKEYASTGTLAGEPLPEGFSRGDELPAPQFTPAAKNDTGHDENIRIDQLRSAVGREMADSLEARSLELFQFARERARKAGFVLADTKFEFGLIDGQLTLIDEALTPDSSRYWDVATWTPGTEPPSFDKQVIRDWLEASGWKKEPPGPELPDSIVEIARQKYAEVLDRLQGFKEITW